MIEEELYTPRQWELRRASAFKATRYAWKALLVLGLIWWGIGHGQGWW